MSVSARKLSAVQTFNVLLHERIEEGESEAQALADLTGRFPGAAREWQQWRRPA